MEEHVLGIGIQNATASNVHVIDQIGFCTGRMVVLAAHLLFQWISKEFIELLILRLLWNDCLLLISYCLFFLGKKNSG
jgi:hypothetical protein